MTDIYFEDETNERQDYLLEKFNEMLGSQKFSEGNIQKQLNKIFENPETFNEKNLANYYKVLRDKKFLHKEILKSSKYDRLDIDNKTFKEATDKTSRSVEKVRGYTKENKVQYGYVEETLIQGKFQIRIRSAKTGRYLRI